MGNIKSFSCGVLALLNEFKKVVGQYLPNDSRWEACLSGRFNRWRSGAIRLIISFRRVGIDRCNEAGRDRLVPLHRLRLWLARAR
ncbi:uncharacterized protein P884DRAFT_207770 [Thermothelomyces heterothallicus CBS 202.75]|uniref:uncharacterized protein n=1 Tax=Thermothelomyces heterothallicus CBS 202.75 TaxID=1149848 RepID=UPI0037432D4C